MIKLYIFDWILPVNAKIRTDKYAMVLYAPQRQR